MRFILLLLVLFIFTNVARAEVRVLRSPNKTANQLIVFIHGFFGGIDRTWTNKTTHFSFPGALRQDSKMSDFDILMYGYDTNCFTGLPVEKLAKDLGDEIKKLGSYDSVSVIAHSLGGNITREAILKNNIDPSKIKNLIFLATPMLGVSVANLYNAICPSKQADALIKKEGSVLDQMNDEWRNQFQQKDRPVTFNFLAGYETIPLFHTKVIVSKDSAVYFAQKVHAFPVTHFGIPKPHNENDEIYTWARDQLTSSAPTLTP